MKLYAKHQEETNSVEILLNHAELKQLLNALNKFEAELEQHKIANKENALNGFTHFHLQDHNAELRVDQKDIVFYVDLNS